MLQPRAAGPLAAALLLSIAASAAAEPAVTGPADWVADGTLLQRSLAQASPPGAVADRRATPMLEPRAVRRGFLEAGSWTFQAYGAAAIGDPDKGEQYDAHLGVGYFFVDHLSINVELLGGFTDGDDASAFAEDGGVGGFDLLFRWHFLERGPWTLYLDGGAGLQVATEDFPSDSRFNFRPQIGLGATYELRENLLLMGGARYLHISNAGTSDVNNGLDAALLDLGVMVPF